MPQTNLNTNSSLMSIEIGYRTAGKYVDLMGSVYNAQVKYSEAGYDNFISKP